MTLASIPMAGPTPSPTEAISSAWTEDGKMGAVLGEAIQYRSQLCWWLYIADTVGSFEDTGAAALEAKGGSNTITNAGHIVMHLGADFDESENQAIYLRGDDNTITNTASGVISDGSASDLGNSAIFMSGESNVVNNTGNITGTVHLGFGDESDTFNSHSGYFAGTVYGGSGNDAIELGQGTATVYGGDGADFLGQGQAPASTIRSTTRTSPTRTEVVSPISIRSTALMRPKTRSTSP